MTQASWFPLGYSRTTGAWTYHSFAFFQNLKPVEIWKCHVNIIWRSLENNCLCKISELWLKNWACHALFNFELLKDVAASFFEPHPPNFGQACIFIDVQMLLVSYFCSSYQKVRIWEILIFSLLCRLQDVVFLHVVV